MTDLESRVARIEKILDTLITLAKTHPAGKTVLKVLGL